MRRENYFKMRSKLSRRAGGRRRLKSLISSLAAVSLVGVGAVNLASAAPGDPLPDTDGVPGPCVSPGNGYNCPANYPADNSNTPFIGYDAAVNTFVGGDFTVQSGAEHEGILVVLGDASFSSSLYNFGFAGVGSRVVPVPNAVAMVVGGDITAQSRVEVGGPSDTPDVPAVFGYDVRYGGTITGEQNITMYEGHAPLQQSGIAEH